MITDKEKEGTPVITDPAYWSLDIKKQSWVEDTENQVEFLIRTLGLTGTERILDLACGYGRHALSFARRGYPVVGVDFSPPFIADAREHAERLGAPAEFVLSDVRAVEYENEFDVVLNMADGAIGYFDSDQENLKIFDVVARALKSGGKHFMDICSAGHAERYYPKRHWEAGEKELSLADFQWNPTTRRMCFTGYQIPYGQPAARLCPREGDWIRLYSAGELEEIFASRDMKMVATFADYHGTPASDRHLQLMAHSVKL